MSKLFVFLLAFSLMGYEKAYQYQKWTKAGYEGAGAYTKSFKGELVWVNRKNKTVNFRKESGKIFHGIPISDFSKICRARIARRSFTTDEYLVRNMLDEDNTINRRKKRLVAYEIKRNEKRRAMKKQALIDRQAHERLLYLDAIDAEAVRKRYAFKEKYGVFKPAGFWDTMRVIWAHKTPRTPRDERRQALFEREQVERWKRTGKTGVDFRK